MPGTPYDGALAEFATLRAEVDTRAKFQQQILALQLTLTTAVVGFAISRPGMVGLLLAVPLGSYLLCGRYVAQRDAIQRVSSYIAGELSPRIPDGLGWVTYSVQSPRPGRLLGWFLPLLVSFPGVGLLALVWSFRSLDLADAVSSGRAGLVGVWVADLIATGISGYLLVRVFTDRTAVPAAEPVAADGVR